MKNVQVTVIMPSDLRDILDALARSKPEFIRADCPPSPEGGRN